MEMWTNPDTFYRLVPSPSRMKSGNSLISHLDKGACYKSFPLYPLPKMSNHSHHFVSLDFYRRALCIGVRLRKRQCTLTKQTNRCIHH